MLILDSLIVLQRRLSVVLSQAAEKQDVRLWEGRQPK